MTHYAETLLKQEDVKGKTVLFSIPREDPGLLPSPKGITDQTVPSGWLVIVRNQKINVLESMNRASADLKIKENLQ